MTISRKTLNLAADICIKEAQKSTMEHQYGAVLVCKNKIVSFAAHNSHKYSAISTKAKQCILCG